MKNKDMLEIYTDYLLSSFGQTTATGLSALLDGSVSHDQVTRFLAGGEFDSSQLWKLVKKTVRKLEQEEGVLIFDDTVQEKKWTDENEIVAWHYDHCEGRSVKGINILNCLYHADGASVPVAFEVVRKTEIYTDEKTGKEKRKSPVTKNEMLRAMLRVCCENQIQFRTVLADCWFASKENMRYIKMEMKKEFVLALKSNRKVALSLQDKMEGRLVKIDSLPLEQNAVMQIYLEGVPFPVLVAKQVFKNKDGSHGELYLVASDLELTWDGVTSLYQKRWNVEVYHKVLKGEAGLAKSPTRTEQTQTAHFFSSIYACFKLECLKLKHALNPFALRGRIYHAALQAGFRELQKMSA